MRDKIQKFLIDEGACFVGVADISGLKKDFFIEEKVLNKLSRAVCYGVQLSRAVIDEIENFPTQVYYHHYRRVNILLDNICIKLTNYMQENGFYAYPVPASLIADWKKQTAAVSLKHLAVAAGIGWIGRNNLLVTEKFGSAVRFGAVLTDMPLTCAQPLKRDCGQCVACIKSCPCGAIKMEKEKFDHTACFEKLKEFTNKGYTRQYICGICIKACLGAKGIACMAKGMEQRA
ncbi:MAG: hypothetical protein ABH836_00910 [Candidatus Omnitrophota bacterium]